MATAALALDPETRKFLKGHLDKPTLMVVEARVDKSATKSKLKNVVAEASETITAMKNEMKALTKNIPEQVLTGVGAAGFGFLIAYKGYDYAVEYFGSDSYAPDLLLPLVGAGIAYYGMEYIKDTRGMNNGTSRAAALGLGGGIIMASTYRSYDRYTAAA